MTKLKVSVIIVAYNSGEYIKECLRSIDKHLQLPHEIIVVDNNSADNTLEVVKVNGVKVNLMLQKSNLGFSKANNLAVAEADGDYLFFLNPDTKILDGKITELVNYLDIHRDTAIAAPKLIDENGDTQPSVQKLPTINNALAQYVMGEKNAYDHYAPEGDSPLEVESVVGGAMVISKKVYQGSGGFSNKYFMYFEDLDLCRKLQKAGWKVVYLPQVRVEHKIGGSASTNPAVKKYIEQSFILYHGPTIAALLNCIHQMVRVKNFFKNRLSV